MFSVGVSMETAKAAINNGFKASDWILVSGSLRFVSTLVIWLVDCRVVDCEVRIFPDIFSEPQNCIAAWDTIQLVYYTYLFCTDFKLKEQEWSNNLAYCVWWNVLG